MACHSTTIKVQVYHLLFVSPICWCYTLWIWLFRSVSCVFVWCVHLNSRILNSSVMVCSLDHWVVQTVSRNAVLTSKQNPVALPTTSQALLLCAHRSSKGFNIVRWSAALLQTPPLLSWWWWWWPKLPYYLCDDGWSSCTENLHYAHAFKKQCDKSKKNLQLHFEHRKKSGVCFWHDVFQFSTAGNLCMLYFTISHKKTNSWILKLCIFQKT